MTLPQSNIGEELSDSRESFKLHQLSKNLLVNSQRSGMLVNTAGHSNTVFNFAALFKTTAEKLDNGP